MHEINYQKYDDLLQKKYIKNLGRVSKIVGLTIESTGPNASMGEVCRIESDTGKVFAEVVGFRDNRILLMPLGDLVGVGLGSTVEALGHSLKVSVSTDLLGRVLDGLGKPIDEKAPIYSNTLYDVESEAPDPLKRSRITEPLTMGIKAIDGLLTIGKGQRIGVFSGSGVGKSTIMGMIARNTHADVNVIDYIKTVYREGAFTPIMSLCVLPNLGLYFLFKKLDYWYAIKGVIISILAYTILVLILKFM
jgi:flagellum-specific ATP synthase